MDRQRVWRAHIQGTQPGDQVIVRHYAVLAPDEDLRDDPPTAVMTFAEWQTRHTEFDCLVDGMPVTPRPGVGVRPPQEPQPPGPRTGMAPD